MASLDPYRYIPMNAPLTKAQIEAMAAEQKKKDEEEAAKKAAKKLYDSVKPLTPSTKDVINNGIVGTTSGFNSSLNALSNILDKKDAKKDATTDSNKPTNPNGYTPVADLNKPTNGSDTASNIKYDSPIGPMPESDGGGNSPGTVPPSTSTQTSNTGTPFMDVLYKPLEYTGGSGGGGGVSNVKTASSQDIANFASAIMQAAKGSFEEVQEPDYLTKHMGSDDPITKPDAPELRTLEELAKQYDITYDYDTLYKLFNDSVEKQYEAIYAKQKQNEDKYYDNAAAAQNTLLDTLSRDRSNAVSAGVSKGMQAANALGAMLGVSQQFANNATALSQERSNTAKDYGADLAKAIVDAEATSNERKSAIMEIAKMLYGYDSEQYVANMDNYSTILTNNAALQQNYLNNKAALQQALASIYNNAASSKITGDANVQSSQLMAQAQAAAAAAQAEATRFAANQSANAGILSSIFSAQGGVAAQKAYGDAIINSAIINSSLPAYWENYYKNATFDNNVAGVGNTGESSSTSAAPSSFLDSIVNGSPGVGNPYVNSAYDAVKNFFSNSAKWLVGSYGYDSLGS